MGINERRGREKADLRRRILDAARELFAAEGFEAVSMRRIAERIEYSPTTLYLYFKDKQEILFELIREGFELLTARASSARDPDPVVRLDQALRCYVAFAFEQPHYYALMFQLDKGESADEPPVCMMEAARDAFHILHNCVEEAVALGRFRADIPVPVAAHAVWSNIHGVVALALARRLAMLPESAHAALFDTVRTVTLEGLRAR